MVGCQWIEILNLYTFSAFLQQHLWLLNHLFRFYWMREHCLIIKNHSVYFQFQVFLLIQDSLFLMTTIC